MNIFRRLSLLTASTLLSSAAVTYAAETVTKWSLDSCINYALSHNLDVRAMLLEHSGAEQGITEAQDRFLPTLSAGASQSWSYGRGLMSDNTYTNRNTSSMGWNASLQLPLFQGLSALRQLRQAHATERRSELRVQQTRDEVTLSVISYYFQALYAREMLAVRREELSLSQVQLQRQETLLEGGKVAEVDVLQARSQVAQSEVAVVNAEGSLNMALLDLARALQLDPDTPFDIEDIPVDDFPVIPTVAEVTGRALHGYSSVLASRAAVDVADRAISTARSGYLPRLSFNAGIGSNYYTLSGAVSQPFGRQMRNNLSKSLGLSLSVPIFDAFTTRNQVRRAQLQRASALLDVERTETTLVHTIRQAHTEAVNARAEYDASRAAVEASRAALDAMTDKYELGRANATEWEQSRSNYTSALARRVGLTYQLLLRLRILSFYSR